MAFKNRIALIRRIERLRNSHVICYLTSIRPNIGAQMAEDAVRVFFDHLLQIKERPIERLDIFLCSNGGSGVVPWRLISLFREYANKIGVLIPYRAYSAATMLALGADEIVMHPFAEMGPIDPTVSNGFNPVDPHTKQRLGISVEDVKAYVSFIKDTVGITHEDELIKAIEILAHQVHPLALGNVERFIAQSRMIARKILLTHMSADKSSHEIDEMIETLASKLYFHGHPINRREARQELRLKVLDGVDTRLEEAMWALYQDFEQELKNDKIFDPMSEIFNQVPAPTAAPAGQPQSPPVIPIGLFAAIKNKLAIVESATLSSAFEREMRLIVVGSGQQLEPLVRQEILSQAWETTAAAPSVAASAPAQSPAPAARRKRKAQPGARPRAAAGPANRPPSP